MSPGLNSSPSAPVKAFRGVNGNLISLDETTDCSQYPSNSGVIKFVLRNNRTFSLSNFLPIILLAIICVATTRPAIPIGVYTIFLVLQCKYFISSVNIDTLLVVESVGVQIIGKRVFSSQESSTFLPWNTLQDVFINEVITGQQVLYYLTFLVRESIGGKEATKLVPLFHELKPERKCLEYINTEDFDYPKELTKVIRRIIKSQPRQGQQFGTRHLLVTYNHSAWMRQDKMFAMLKFRERTDATAFPHAFVLTVQTLNGSSAEELCQVDKDEDCTNANPDKANDGRVLSTDKANKGTAENDSPDHRTDSHGHTNLKLKDKIEDFGKISSPDKSGTTTTSSSSRELERERKTDPGKKRSTPRKSVENIEEFPRIMTRNRRGYTGHEKSKNRVPPDSAGEKGIAADFADLPYQYIIEKEIEDSKSSPLKANPNTTERDSSPGTSLEESDLPGKSLSRSPRAAQAETARSADITDLVMEGLMFTIRQDQDSVTVVEQKTKLEIDEVLENSEKAETKEGEKCLLNSSLLKLENLITKIEMSESKFKCNEDITMSPRAVTNEKIIKPPFVYNSPGNVINSEYRICGPRYDAGTVRVGSPGKSKQLPPHSQSIDRSSTSDMPKFPLVKINLSNVRDVLSDRFQYYDHAKGRDITGTEGEAMKTNGKQNEMRNWEMEEEDEVGLELKYEEKDDAETDKVGRKDDEKEEIIPEALQQKPLQDFMVDGVDANARSELNTQITPTRDRLKTTKCTTPRIVSNEIVTDDQIPPVLQKALRYKRLKRMRLCHNSDIARDTAANLTEDDHTNDNYMSEMKWAVSPLIKEVSSRVKITDNSPNGQSSPTIDITEEFQRELRNEKSRKQPIRRKGLRHAEQISTNANQGFMEEPEVRLDMWKFMQDITRGAKVVIRRLDLTNISNGIAAGSFLSKYKTSQHVAES